jgi:hypothetical protein
MSASTFAAPIFEKDRMIPFIDIYHVNMLKRT